MTAIMFKTSKILVTIMVFALYHQYRCESEHNNCRKYGVDEDKPMIYGGERFCLNRDGFDFCRTWSCPPECSNFEKWPGKCEACEGTCSYGGRIYNISGESFPCIDNSNTCKCRPNNSISSTRVAQHADKMCADKPKRVKP